MFRFEYMKRILLAFMTILTVGILSSNSYASVCATDQKDFVVDQLDDLNSQNVLYVSNDFLINDFDIEIPEAPDLPLQLKSNFTNTYTAVVDQKVKEVCHRARDGLNWICAE